MKHAIYRITACQVVGPHRLRLRFDDGVSRTIDFRPMLRGELFAPLMDLTLFNQVRIDPETETIVWPNGADFDPATLHDWPAVERTYTESHPAASLVREPKPPPA
jgi:hypothetical protein